MGGGSGEKREGRPLQGEHEKVAWGRGGLGERGACLAAMWRCNGQLETKGEGHQGAATLAAIRPG